MDKAAFKLAIGPSQDVIQGLSNHCVSLYESPEVTSDPKELSNAGVGGGEGPSQRLP